MRQYETMVLLSPELSEEVVEERISAFESQITEGGGAILKVDRWGKKRLAYPIKRQRHGIYFLITYESDFPAVQEIERQLRLQEDTWRYMTVRMDPALLRKLAKNAERAEARARMEGRRGSGRDSEERPSGRERERKEADSRKEEDSGKEADKGKPEK
ncbi:MAG: 30S ribosomal protein S6 [bacterium]